MSQNKVHETHLPGVGVQHDFDTADSRRVGVITHYSGRRDLLLFSNSDPDMCTDSIKFTEDESRLLGELLGASQVEQSLRNLQQRVGGLAIDWIQIHESWACNGISLRELGLKRTQIAAVIRDKTTYPTPEADFTLHADDTVVLIGTPDGIEEAAAIMQGEE